LLLAPCHRAREWLLFVTSMDRVRKEVVMSGRISSLGGDQRLIKTAMSEANREKGWDEGVRIIAVVGKGGCLMRRYERA